MKLYLEITLVLLSGEIKNMSRVCVADVYLVGKTYWIESPLSLVGIIL